MSDNPQKGFLDRLISEADESAHPFLEKIRDHIRTIVLVVAVIVVSAAGYSLYSFLQDRKVSVANEEFEAVLAVEDPERKISGIEEFLKTAPARLEAAALLEMARTAMDAENFQLALESFQRLADKGSDMRPLAILGQAKACQLMGQHSKAVEILQNASLPEEFQTQYLTLLSFNAEKAEQYSAALQAYQNLLETAQGADQGFIEYKIESLKQKS